VGAVVLAIVAYVLRTKVSRDRVRDWVRARSVAEALKEEIFRFLVGARPYGPNRSAAAFVERLQTHKAKVQDLYLHAAAVDPVQKERLLAPLTMDQYVGSRVNDQIDNYYIPMGRANARAANRLRDYEFALGLLAVILGAAASATSATGLTGLSTLGSWVAVVTTATAAVTAHLAAARYDHQAITFFGTANRIGALRDAWRADPDRLDETRAGRFVDDCESAISSENEAWLAGWTQQDEGTPAV
jgi:hypothetical protein